MVLDADNQYTMRDLCAERDPNIQDALLNFYNRAKEAKDSKISGQLVFYVKNGVLESWSAPRTGRIRKGK